MAADPKLVARIRRRLVKHGAVEKRMFGGVAFLINGHMCLGVHGDELIVRLSPESAEKLLTEPGARPFDLGGRPIKGWLLVSGENLRGSSALTKWTWRAISFALTLPGKA
jgi:TfoX/Sxy family transcriptional regulator of competence genes